MARHRHADLLGTDVAKVRLDANHAAFRRLAETRDLAVLQDIHAERRSRTRIAPSHGVVAGRATARLHETTEHGVARIGCGVQQRNALLHFFACEHEGVDAVQVHGAHPAVTGFHVVARMQHVHDAALAEHDVVVQVLRQAFVQAQRKVVERGTLRVVVVRADDGGVAAGVAATQPATLQHRHVRNAVVLGEVVGAGQAMATATDNHHVVTRLRFRGAPGRLPATVAGKPLPQHVPGVVALHPQGNLWRAGR